uniref:Uncharacterized protein n=1 Tax=Moniliophthora roreri TaxID=221103 RepID=A0A0W0G008_MONRR
MLTDGFTSSSPRIIAAIMSVLHTAAQPPIHSILPELLSEIFLNVDTREADGFVTQSTFACSSADGDKSRSTGSHLGSVCRHWRSVTLDTPALWASLRISVIPGWHRDPLRALERVLMHLKRSADAPLSIHLTIANATSLVPIVLDQSAEASAELETWCFLVRLIFSQAERIRYFAFLAKGIFTEDSSATSILSSFRPRFTSLVHLSLFTPKSLEGVLDLSTFPIHSFTLHQPCRSDNFIRWHILPFSNITNIILLDVTPLGVKHLLPHFPNLRVAELRLCSDGSNSTRLGVAQLHFPHLHTLVIEDTDKLSTDDLCSVLKAMVLPVLSHLSLSIQENWDPIFLMPSQQSIYPAIQHLIEGVCVFRMARLPFDCKHISPLLEKMRNVVELEVTQMVVRSDMAGTLLLEELCKEGVMPKLRDLQLVLRRRPEVGLFERMRKSRMGVLRWADLKVEDDQEGYELHGLQFA